MNNDQRIVITGVGVVSPIGIGVDPFWDALINRVSGVRVRDEFVDTDIPIRLAAQVRDFDPKPYVNPRKSIKLMCNPIQFGCAAATMACQQANVQSGEIDPDRLGILFGTETFYANPTEVAGVFQHCVTDQGYQHERWGEFAMRKIQPLWMLKYLPNMAASHISIALDARGHSNSICQSEASGLIAFIEAATVIERGWCDVVVAGGTGSLCELTSMLYRGNNLSTRYNNQPEKSSRPFDFKRDGMIAGEGAGAIVLETAKHAAARGAQPLAFLNGWSRQFGIRTAGNFSHRIGDCFQDAVQDAKMQPDQIDFINADASGSIPGDAAEAQAINRVFGRTPVVAHKGNFGNLGPSTSTVELIGAIMSLQKRQLPPTLNFDFPDPVCPIDVSPKHVISLESGRRLTVLKSSVSNTGQIASVVLSSS